MNVKGVEYLIMAEEKVKNYPKIFIAGDSTAASYSGERFPMMGWGQVIGYYLQNVCIVNLAQCGRSSRSFITEGWFALIEKGISKNDFLLVQFGHNDEKSQDPSRYTDPESSYPEHLMRYVDLARSRGANPVLITPVARRKFEDGKLIDTHKAYADAVRKLSETEQIPYVDLTALSMKLMEGLGEDASKRLFTKVQPGEYPGYPEGHDDDTHFCQEGALEIASLVGGEIKKLFPNIF